MAAIIQYKLLQRRAKEQLESLKDYHEHTKHASSCSSTGHTSSIIPQHDPAEGLAKSQEHIGKAIYPYATMDGISVQRMSNGESFYQVDWESGFDPRNPRNWPLRKRCYTTLLLDVVAMVVTVASAIESAVAPQAAQDFGASELLQALGGTGLFLIGFGIGALLAAPASEIFGRYLVYLASLIICGCWLLGAALAPNSGSHAFFRFMAGFFASAPLTVAGGSMSDIWNTRDMTWAFPMFAVVGFGGPVAAPVIASYIGQSSALSWRWAEWLVLILNAFAILMLLLAMEETLGPRLLQLKAKHFRKLTGDQRFQAASEAESSGLRAILKKNFTRPFILALEPIVLCLTLYNSVVYVIQFTFLVGYPYIFQKVYDIEQGLKNLCFLGLLVGVLLSITVVPFVVLKTKRQLCRDGDDGSGDVIHRESRLVFAMIGAPFLPVGLLWMGWTDYPSVPIWSPLAASIVIGFGTVCIFISSYMYVIDSYQVYAASALTFVTLVRYVAAGIMTVVGIPMYKNLGTHWTLTILGCISTLIAPVPYVLYIWGERIRAKSKYAALR